MNLQNYKKGMFHFYQKVYFRYLTWLAIGFLPFILKSDYHKDCLVLTLLWAGVAMGWNILGGYAGQLSIGHAAFFGMGAYVSTLLYMNYGLSPWIGMLIGGLIVVVFAGFVGLITLRLRGPFFVLATIAYAEVMRISAISWRSLTRGSFGIFIPSNLGFWNMTWRGKDAYIWLTLVYMLLVYIVCRTIESRKFGYYLVALRENNAAALALGIDTTKMKVLATLISAFITAIGGSIYAQYMMFVEPSTVFGIMWSVQIALIAIVGGLGIAGGPILGAFLLIPLSTFFKGALTKYSGLSGLVYGFVLIVVIFFIREGLLPKILKLWERWGNIYYNIYKNKKA